MTTRTRRRRTVIEKAPSAQTLAGANPSLGDVVRIAGYPSGPFRVVGRGEDGYELELVGGCAGPRRYGPRTLIEDGR